MEVWYPGVSSVIALRPSNIGIGFNGGAMICIVLVEGMLLKVVLPMIQFYMVLIPIIIGWGQSVSELLRLLRHYSIHFKDSGSACHRYQCHSGMVARWHIR